MSLYNTINIKNLPQIDQVLRDDFLVVENFAGTYKINFDDFVIGPRNTSFYNSIANTILELSGKSLLIDITNNNVDTRISYVSSVVDTGSFLITSNTSRLNSLSSDVDRVVRSINTKIITLYGVFRENYYRLNGGSLNGITYSTITPIQGKADSYELTLTDVPYGSLNFSNFVLSHMSTDDTLMQFNIIGIPLPALTVGSTSLFIYKVQFKTSIELTNNHLFNLKAINKVTSVV